MMKVAGVSQRSRQCDFEPELLTRTVRLALYPYSDRLLASTGPGIITTAEMVRASCVSLARCKLTAN